MARRPRSGTPGVYDQTIAFRVPPELKDALERAAKAADRNLSQECLRRLRMSFDREHPPTSAPNVTTISKYANRKE